MTNCPNCNKSLTGIFGSSLVPQTQIDLINKAFSMNKVAYCTSCGDVYLNKIDIQAKNHRASLQSRISNLIQFIPVISSQAPSNWVYEVIDMVTSQRTSGTGFLTELSQSWNDAWGASSGATDRKIANATNWCKSDLRNQCAKLGGHAVIATDIDFSEVGTGSTNMLMVCMAGTAIKVHDVTKISSVNGVKLIEVQALIQELATLPK